MAGLTGSDLEAVRLQLGREPSVPFDVVARCAGPRPHPLVIRNAPQAPDGAPFPTRYWLTCPDACAEVARLESRGWIARLSAKDAEEPEGLGARLQAAHAAYAAEREAVVGGAGAHGGVGGTARGVKCLHAHYAYHLAGGDDPVGEWVAGRLAPFHPPRLARPHAAIDMGTNSVRLLVAEPPPPGGEGLGPELTRDMVITRLGQDVDRTGRLAPEALARTTAVLAVYGRRARALGAASMRVGATSAVRDAANRRELEDAVRRLTGAGLEVVGGDLEAKLSFLGAVTGLDAPAPFLVFDIGGGSTEFVVGTDAPEAAISTQMGSVRLTERLVSNDPPTRGELADLDRAVGEVLSEVERAIPVGSARTLVGVAGTATTMAAIAAGLPRYDPELIHRSWLDRGDAVRVHERLASMTNAARAALPVMARGREDVIVAGSAVLVAVMRRWGFDRLLVSESDILDGLLIDGLRAGGGGVAFR